MNVTPTGMFHVKISVQTFCLFLHLKWDCQQQKRQWHVFHHILLRKMICLVGRNVLSLIIVLVCALELELYRRKRVSVRASSGSSMSFMITPKKLGHITIIVTASSPVAGDSVVKKLLVKVSRIISDCVAPIWYKCTNILELYSEDEGSRCLQNTQSFLSSRKIITSLRLQSQACLLACFLVHPFT